MVLSFTYYLNSKIRYGPNGSYSLQLNFNEILSCLRILVAVKYFFVKCMLCFVIFLNIVALIMPTESVVLILIYTCLKKFKHFPGKADITQNILILYLWNVLAMPLPPAVPVICFA